MTSHRDFKEVNISRLSQIEQPATKAESCGGAQKLKKCIENIEKMVMDGNDRSEVYKRINEAKMIAEEISQSSNPSINTTRRFQDR
jgi:hypothetical protein